MNVPIMITGNAGARIYRLRLHSSNERLCYDRLIADERIRRIRRAPAPSALTPRESIDEFLRGVPA